MTTRTERDTFGPIEVPANHLWGAQTQRSLQNFDIAGDRMPRELIDALSQQTGVKISAVHSPREQRRVWLEMAQKNAQIQLARLRKLLHGPLGLLVGLAFGGVLVLDPAERFIE